MDLRYVFSENLKRARLDRGWTQQQAAEKAGLRPAAWSFFEQGRRLPNLVNLRRVCVALEISADQLIDL